MRISKKKKKVQLIHDWSKLHALCSSSVFIYTYMSIVNGQGVHSKCSYLAVRRLGFFDKFFFCFFPYYITLDVYKFRIILKNKRIKGYEKYRIYNLLVVRSKIVSLYQSFKYFWFGSVQHGLASRSKPNQPHSNGETAVEPNPNHSLNHAIAELDPTRSLSPSNRLVSRVPQDFHPRACS